MKSNRSNKYTIGICDIINDNLDQRFCFFELDELDQTTYERITHTYNLFHLDVLIHRTLKGWHWLSPTIVSKDYRKMFHNNLKEINTDCPMNCLRWHPNKYPEESSIWYNHEVFKFRNGNQENCIEMCNLLDMVFKSNFYGTVHGKIKLVSYPLPIVIQNG